MQSVPCEPWPSSLLWLGDESRFLEPLSQECSAGRSLSLPVLEAWRKRADELLAQSEANACALILICLADQYRAIGRRRQGLDCLDKAGRYLNRFPEEEHLHNHAVVQYALGLALEDQDALVEALHAYGEATKGFHRAGQRWMRSSAFWQRRCGDAMRWLQQRMERLAVSGNPSSSPGPQVPVRVLGRVAAGEPIRADQPSEGSVLVAADRARRVHFALRVQGESMIDEGIAPGDLVLVERDESVPSHGDIVVVYVEGVDTEATLKKCYQEADHYRLEPANKKEPFRILMADSADEQKIRELYAIRNPGRELAFFLAEGARVVGWMRGLIHGSRP